MIQTPAHLGNPRESGFAPAGMSWIKRWRVSDRTRALKHARYVRSCGSISPDAGITAAHMRTIIAPAIDEIPPGLRARIAMNRPTVSWQDYDDAKRLIAVHLVARIRESVRCHYGGSDANGGHG